MFLTEENLNKIYKYIKAKAVKDSDFDLISNLLNDDTIVISSKGHNKNIRVKDFIDNLFELGSSDFINVTNSLGLKNVELQEVLNMFPFRARKKGIVITFLNELSKWVIYQFEGDITQWNNPTLWKQVNKD